MPLPRSPPLIAFHTLFLSHACSLRRHLASLAFFSFPSLSIFSANFWALGATNLFLLPLPLERAYRIPRFHSPKTVCARSYPLGGEFQSRRLSRRRVEARHRSLSIGLNKGRKQLFRTCSSGERKKVDVIERRCRSIFRISQSLRVRHFTAEKYVKLEATCLLLS